MQFAKHSEGNFIWFSQQMRFKENKKINRGIEKIENILINETGYSVLMLRVTHSSDKTIQL